MTDAAPTDSADPETGTTKPKYSERSTVLEVCCLCLVLKGQNMEMLLCVFLKVNSALVIGND